MTQTALPTIEVLPPAPDIVDGSDAAITCHGLTKRYGSLLAVHDAHLEVPRGATFGLIGPNGAGKTTTMSILASLLLPTAGWCRVGGADPVREPHEVRRHVGFMPDVLGVYDGTTVTQYLEFFAGAYRIPRRRWPSLIDGLLDLVDLRDKRGSQVNALSRGMKQRLSLARALVHDPGILILDEPASGLDPRARVDLRTLLLTLRELGKTVVISSHILPELQEVCTDVAIMEAGRLLACGPPDHILEQLGGGRAIRVRLAGGEERQYTVRDDAEQETLLRGLLDEGLPVLEFTRTGGGLEDLFLKITKGVVQ
ncbi:MAG: ABC transporter ATP-binding protein [Acidimicrobiales bacterium]